jgi:hypothetical protein
VLERLLFHLVRSHVSPSTPFPKSMTDAKNRSTLRILHLSDFHQGVGGQRILWPTVKSKFFDDLAALAKQGPPWDLILFSGDLTQQGSTKDFAAFTTTLSSIFEKLAELGSTPQLFAVPGNHDLIRPEPTGAAVRALSHWKEDTELRSHFWSSSTNEYRALINRAFAPYTNWRRNERRHLPVTEGILPGDVVASIPVGDHRVGLIGLNSAFLQLSGGDHEGNLDASVDQLLGLCGEDPASWFDRHGLCLLVTHHPTKWLHPKAQTAFLNDIFDPTRIAMHIYGHMHEARQRSLALGGAAARNELQSPSLFGLENWSRNGVNAHRSHGYIDITIELAGDTSSITLRPRTLRISDDGQLPPKIIPDHQNFELQNETATLSIPMRKCGKRSSPSSSHRNSPPLKCYPSGIIVTELMPEAVWRRILVEAAIVNDSATLVDDVNGEITFKDSSPPVLVKCISGAGRILSEREIEIINTQVDRSEYVGATIVTVTEPDEAAQTLAERFGRKKQFELCGPTQIAQRLFSTSAEPLRDHLAGLDHMESEAQFLLTPNGNYVVIGDLSRQQWFYVVEADGVMLQEDHAAVVHLRKSVIHYAGRTYGPRGTTPQSNTTTTPFDRNAYLSKAHTAFESLQYSAVAPVGFGFPQGKLLDVYVAPSADMQPAAAAAEAQKQELLSEILQSIELDDTQRKQLEIFFAGRKHVGSLETDYARALYKQHRNVVVLGDPGLVRLVSSSVRFSHIACTRPTPGIACIHRS